MLFSIITIRSICFVKNAFLHSSEASKISFPSNHWSTTRTVFFWCCLYRGYLWAQCSSLWKPAPAELRGRRVRASVKHRTASPEEPQNHHCDSSSVKKKKWILVHLASHSEDTSVTGESPGGSFWWQDFIAWAAHFASIGSGNRLPCSGRISEEGGLRTCLWYLMS